ncbi:MAG: SAM-dependent methyltransferase, partial [Candidatus Latescibacteria bacterium]|nr:SAM-dependent methyltransferase [Candidatus Latescibacterota bacterium]
RGINWDSQAIVVAPCCQHELRPQIQAPAMQAIMRYGLLKQRTAEIVTDAVRAQALRIMGYRTGVVEFVYPSHTPKNLMIRAQKVRESGDVAMIREYLELRDYWHVEPRLEKLIGDSFLSLIEGYRETA